MSDQTKKNNSNGARKNANVILNIGRNNNNSPDDNEWTSNKIARFCEKEIGTNLIRRILLLLNAVVVVLHKYNFRIILFVCFVCHFLSS